jgi:hypothetical protein
MTNPEKAKYSNQRLKMGVLIFHTPLSIDPSSIKEVYSIETKGEKDRDRSGNWDPIGGNNFRCISIPWQG